MRSIMMVLLMFTGAARAQQAPVALDTNQARFSYAVGTDLAQSLKPVTEFVDREALEAGLRDGIAGREPRLDETQREAAKKMVTGVLAERTAKERAAIALRNQKAADEFLAQNRLKPGIGTTPSGLQYQIISQGQGVMPEEADSVKVNYRGTLPDGTEFDSSYGAGGEPVQFEVKGVIPGWIEGLQLMKQGGKFRFYVPPALAYAERGAGAKIGPNQLLIFEVELLEVYGPPEAQSANTP